MRQSSLRSLKELQNRKKLQQIVQQTSIEQKLQQQQQQLQQSFNDYDKKLLADSIQPPSTQNYRSLLNNSYHSQRLPAQSEKGGGLNKMNQTMQKDLQLPPMINQEISQRSLIVEQAIKGGQSLLRKRSPSDYMRRKSTPVTPKKNINNITVPQAVDYDSFQLIQMTSNRNGLNLSTLQAVNDKKMFTSLSQTPKFDMIGGLKVLSQGDNTMPPGTQSQQPSLAIPNFRQQRLRAGSNNGSRQYLIAGSKSNSRIKQRQGMPGGQAWEKSNVNQFQVRDAQPLEVLQQLQEITSKQIGLSTLRPQDLDSTEQLDSFIDSLYMIIENYVMQYNDQVRNKLQHLATGIRTESCEDFMSYICELQNRNKVLIDSVEYFTGHITKLGELEDLKVQNENQIKLLKQEKEEIFLQRIDIDRKYTEALQFIETQKKKNQDLTKQLKSLTQQFERKSEECESLNFRLKNIQDLESMLEPPNINQSLANEVNSQSDPADIDVSPTRHQNLQLNLNFQDEKLKGLEAMNKKLESELLIMKAAIQKDQESKFNDNVDHFVKIQELFNKVQIENKTLRIKNTKLESKLESKEKLISHLEKKVTTVMVEKEEIIIKLKSEIVILKNLIEMNEKKFDTRLQTEQEKFQKQLQVEFKARFKQLENDKEDLTRENGNQLERISQLKLENEKLSSEFSGYKEDAILKEQETQKLLSEVQTRLKQANQLQYDTSNELQQRIENLENLISVQTKQLSIQDLKLQFVKESTQNLLRQKNFLIEDLQKSKKQLTEESDSLEVKAAEQNPANQDYLISIKKAVAQSKAMLQIGLNSLSNSLQIVSFLKIEELLQMIVEQERNLKDNIQTDFTMTQMRPHEINEEQNDLDKISQQIAQEEIQQQDLTHDSNIVKNQTLEIKKVYTEHKQSQQNHIQPVSGLQLSKFMQQDSQQDQSQNRDENYFLVYCPIEVSSALIKIVAEIFNFSHFNAEEIQLPLDFDNLMNQASEKSDLNVEHEIMQKFLVTTRNMIEDQISKLTSENEHLKIQLETFNNQTQDNVVPNQSRKGFNKNVASYIDEDDDVASSSPTISPINKHKNQNNTNQANQQNIVGNFSAPAKTPNLEQRTEQYNIQDFDQSDKTQNQKRELKHKSMAPGLITPNLKISNLSKQNLSGSQFNILGLQDQENLLESSSRLGKKSARKQKLDALQQAQNEIEQLKLSLQEYKQKSKDLQLQLASKIVSLEEQIDELTQERTKQFMLLEEKNKIDIEKTKTGVQQRENQLLQRIEDYKTKIKEHKYSRESLEIEIKSLREEMMQIIDNIQNFDQQLKVKDEIHDNYKENVQSYINLKTSQRNIFGIALESSNSNMSMINESMLKYYLNKCLKLDKNKFRFLSTQEERYELELAGKGVNRTQKESVLVVKLIIEIIDDQENFDQYFKMLKNQIRDGSCLLYDLDPLYISINLGQTGINSRQLISDYHFIFKKGIKVNQIKEFNILQIQEEDYLLSVLRHTSDALAFKLIAMNFHNGEEYILDLSERDLFELTEGKNDLLMRNEPKELLDIMVANLVIITKDQGIRVLGCEHKVFFNGLFHQQKQKAFSNVSQHTKIDNFSLGVNYRNLYIRDEKIKQVIESKSNHVKPEYQSQFKNDSSCQTDPIHSFLNESLITAYCENQRVGKHLEFKVMIQYGKNSQSMVISFEEIISKVRLQMALFQQAYDGSFLIHSECLKISDSKTVLISIEKFQKDGMFVKIHNLKDLESKEFFLVKKSNSAYCKLEKNAGLDLIQKEDFRSLIYDLTFASNIPSNEVLMASFAHQQEQQFMKNLDDFQPSDNFQNSVIEQLSQPPSRKRIGQTQVLTNTELAQRVVQLAKPVFKILDDSQNIGNQLLQKNEKGILLYRNVYIKMSIASQVSMEDLFGSESDQLTFSQQIKMLDQMMERLYVLSENQTYHLKVENEAVPISLILEQRRQAFSVDSNTMSNGSVDKVQAEIRCKEIQENRDHLLNENRCQQFASYAYIKGLYYDFKVYFLFKNEKNDSTFYPSPRKKQSMLKKMFERQTTNLEALIEDTLDYDQIFIEVIDQSKQVYSTHLNQKSLSMLISQNPYEYKNNIGLVSNKNKDKLVEFLKNNSRLDHENMAVIIENSSNTQDMIDNFYKNQYGGTYTKREDQLNKKDQNETKLIEKKLVMNQEIDMSEFTYDIKLYLIIEKKEEEAQIAYSLEIFALNDPDIVYIYNQPSTKKSNAINVPSIIGIDVINLIENPIKSQEVIIENTEEQIKNKKQNFQDLFAKYIDNRLLIIVNEQSFPWKLSYCLIEPCSRLSWTFNLDSFTIQALRSPATQISKEIGVLEILDQADFEVFLAQNIIAVMDLNNNHLQVEQFENQEGMWNDVGDNEMRYELTKDKKIADSYIINISKLGEDLVEVQLRPKTQKKSDNFESNSDIKDLTNKLNSLTIVINTNNQFKQQSQIVKLNNQEKFGILQSYVSNSDITVRLIDIVSRKVLYQYHYHDQDSKQFQTNQPIEQALIFGLRQILNKSTVDNSLRQLLEFTQSKENISHLANQIFELGDIQQNKDSLANTLSNETQSIVLHRKTFFDDSQEKLIIVAIEIQTKLKYKKQPRTNKLISECEENIESLFLKINEPETEALNNALQKDSQVNPRRVFELQFSQCFHEEELRNINFKNIEQLKKLARVIIEERAVINRVQDPINESYDASVKNNKNISGQSGQQNQYKIEINLGNTAYTLGGDSIKSPMNDLQNFDQAQEQRRAMENFRKANNVSANGQRKHHDGRNMSDVQEEDLENEQHEDRDINDQDLPDKPNIGKISGSPKQSLIKNNTFKNQHQILEQSVIEEEGSQEENDDSPPKFGNEEHSRSVFNQSMQQPSMDDSVNDQQKAQMSHNHSMNQLMNPNINVYDQTPQSSSKHQLHDNPNDRSLSQNQQHQQSSHIQIQTDNNDDSQDEDSMDNQSDSLKHQVEKVLPRDHILEVGVTQNNQNQLMFVALKKSNQDQRILKELKFREDEVMKLLNIDNINNFNIAQVVDDLSDFISDQNLLN
eukprot:403364949